MLRYSKELMQMIKTPNSSPKYSKSVVYLPHANNLGLHLFYLNTEQNEPKKFFYTNPRVGGSFNLSHELLEEYEFLIDFIISKPLSAKIISKLQKKLKQKNDLTGS